MALDASKARAFMRDYLERAGGDANERSDNVDISLAVIISLQTSREQCISARSRSAALSGWKQFASRQKQVPFSAESVGRSAIVDVLASVVENTLINTSGPDIFMFQVLVAVSVIFMFASRMTVDCFYDGPIDDMVDICESYFDEFGDLDPKRHRELLDALFRTGASIHRQIEDMKDPPVRPDRAATDLAVSCAGALVQSTIPRPRLENLGIMRSFARHMQLMIYQGLFWSSQYEVSYDSWEDARSGIARVISHAVTLCLCRTLVTSAEDAERVAMIRLVTSEDGSWIPEETDAVAEIINSFLS